MMLTKETLREELKKRLEGLGFDINTIYTEEQKDKIIAEAKAALKECLYPIVKEICREGNKMIITFEVPFVEKSVPIPVDTPKKYYTKVGSFDCPDACKFKEGLMIGSMGCMECVECRGHDNEEQWVKCKLYGAEQ